jgi:hypothetical protein
MAGSTSCLLNCPPALVLGARSCWQLTAVARPVKLVTGLAQPRSDVQWAPEPLAHAMLAFNPGPRSCDAHVRL